MFDYTVKTDQTVEAVVEKLKTTLKEEEFGVLWDFNLSETLEEKGQAIDGDYRILEVCNPKEAKKSSRRTEKAGISSRANSPCSQRTGRPMSGCRSRRN